jgi:NAD(P)-dependent dehydrogenase (short-subunit alcohol dehydrogenase family)
MTAERKVAFVTGASSGIGRATARAFAARGYATALVDRDETLGREVESELGQSSECLFIRCDVADDYMVRLAVEETVGRFGRLDAAFNAAGIDGEAGRTTAECTLENWNRVIGINLTGVWSCMRYQIPEMLKTGGGSIVNCASVAGLVGAPYVAAYVASKHGVVGLTKAAAVEYGGQNLRVNAVCPGMIDTPLSPQFLIPEVADALLANCPIGRFAEPEVVADAVLWLSEPGASFVTGQAIAIDGGWTAK